MGNSQSSSANLLSDSAKNELLQKVQDIAGSYASTLNFDDLTNLFDDSYCSQIEILTKNIIDKNLNNIQIEYLAQHLQKGQEVDLTKIDNITYVKHAKNLKKNQQTRKNRLCAGLAKYFIKIFKIYAAITKTINPVFSENQEGLDEKVDVFKFYGINPDTYKIDENSNNLNMKLNKLENICDYRIEILKSLYDKKLVANLPTPEQAPVEQKPVEEKPIEQKTEEQTPVEQAPIEQAPIEQQPTEQPLEPTPVEQTNESEIEEKEKKERDINIIQKGGNDDKTPAFCSYKGETLIEQYGIKELEDLFKDKFNFTKNMYEMSPESEEQYKNTVINMYKAFSGKNETPDETIKTFNDIKLLNYNEEPLCLDKIEDTNLKFSNSDTNLFIKYANHLNNMISKTFQRYDLLLVILNEIFQFDLNEKTGKTSVHLKKNLSEEKINQLFFKTRDVISQMYIDCQEDFIKGVNMYKSIVYSKLLQRNKSRQINLQKQMNKII